MFCLWSRDFYCSFIYDVTVSSSDYIAQNIWIISKEWFGNDVGIAGRWLTWLELSSAAGG
jgi:hypothetical protein